MAPTPKLSDQGFGKVTPILSARLSHGAYHYNGSLIRRSDGYWIVYRRQQSDGRSDLAIAKLTEEWAVVPGTQKVLRMPHTSHLEDPRAFWYRGKVHVSYAVWEGNWGYRPYQALCRLNEAWEVEEEIPLPYRANRQNLTPEKNWCFFDHAGRFLFVYWGSPHTVVELRDGECNRVEEIGWKFDWKHGQMRGGTPPVRVGDMYYSFFHSSTRSKGDNDRVQYHMGAYAFEAKPPFRPVSYTRVPLLSGSALDPELPWAPLVVFPCGAVHTDGRWAVSVGVNDYYLAVVEFSHRNLSTKLFPVEQYLSKTVRLIDPNRGIPGGFRFKHPRANKVISANNWNNLLRNATKDGLSEAEVHELVADKLPPNRLAEIWTASL